MAMNIKYLTDSGLINWNELKQDLINDNFHNGRTTDQLRLSFENSQVQIYAQDHALKKKRCIGTARALSDLVGNAYVIDVWTQTTYRKKGIARCMMDMIVAACPGQHIYLMTDDAQAFYRKIGFTERPTGMEIISGAYLVNETSQPD